MDAIEFIIIEMDKWLLDNSEFTQDQREEIVEKLKNLEEEYNNS